MSILLRRNFAKCMTDMAAGHCRKRLPLDWEQREERREAGSRVKTQKIKKIHNTWSTEDLTPAAPGLLCYIKQVLTLSPSISGRLSLLLQADMTSQTKRRLVDSCSFVVHTVIPFYLFFLLYCSCCATSDRICSHFENRSGMSKIKKLKVMDSLVPLVELYGQTNDFILCDVERLHHFPRFQLTVLGVEVPPPFHFIWETEMHHKPRLCQNKPENKSFMMVWCSKKKKNNLTLEQPWD